MPQMMRFSIFKCSAKLNSGSCFSCVQEISHLFTATKKCCFGSCRRWGHSLGRPCWPPSAYKHFGTHRGEQFVANKKAILSRHDSIQSIAVSCHVHMYAYICIYSCMHRLFLHMIYNRWDKPLDLYRALRRGLLASGTR